MNDKAQLIRALCEQLGAQEQTLQRAAQAAREAATHEESKPENDKDTRALEASYLAGAQAARASEIKAIKNALTFLPLRQFKATDPIALSALVEVTIGPRRARYFLAPHGGGMKVASPDGQVVVVTAASPLGQALLGKCVGDALMVAGADAEIVGVY